MISFKYRHFDKDIILMSVRWYVAYSLSYRDIEELLLERNINIDHSTINRWVIKYSPQLLKAFKKNKKRVGCSWRADETYIKVKGKWTYQYRAVDKSGQTIDIYLSKKRDKTAAKRFFKKSIGSSGRPEKITIDKSGSNLSALETINQSYETNEKIQIRQIKYLNNIVEQDHRFIKKITKPMMGFKAFQSARATLQGVELHHMLRKKQHQLSNKMTVPEQFYALAA